MIEFYSKYFKKNFGSKINQLIEDIKRLLELENINIEQEGSYVLDIKFKKNLNIKTWDEVNSLYRTLYKHHDNISDTLKKFINKNITAEKSQFKFIDTFAGCGGLSLGFINSGFQPVLVNEIEPKYLETYYFNHSIDLEKFFCVDIKEVAQDKSIHKRYKNIDLIAGGPPCQGFSMANRQRIIDDPRNHLYKHFLILLAKVQPKFFIMENVKGMIKKSNEILNDFESHLGSEYTIKMILLNAKDFGIPQNRERVFVIGSKVSTVPAESITSEILRDIKKYSSKNLKDALYGLPKLEPKKDKNTKGLENEKIGFKFRLNLFEDNEFIRKINSRRTVQYLCNHVNRYNNERDIEIFGRLPQGENSLHQSIADIMPYSSRNHMFKDKYYKLKETSVSKTITSHMKMDCNMYIHPNEARGLSPREAARIQTFPDDFVFMGANNTWYAQIGNAVPVKLAELIGEKIMQKLKTL